jgi:hypothetical protein
MSLKNTAACLGYQQVTVLSTAVGLTIPSNNAGNGDPTYVVIQAEAQAVRWRDDGAAPTASVGMTIPAGGELRYDGNLAAIQFIEAAASAKLNVSYYA